WPVKARLPEFAPEVGMKESGSCIGKEDLCRLYLTWLWWVEVMPAAKPHRLARGGACPTYWLPWVTNEYRKCLLIVRSAALPRAILSKRSTRSAGKWLEIPTGPAFNFDLLIQAKVRL